VRMPGYAPDGLYHLQIVIRLKKAIIVQRSWFSTSWPTREAETCPPQPRLCHLSQNGLVHVYKLLERYCVDPSILIQVAPTSVAETCHLRQPCPPLPRRLSASEPRPCDPSHRPWMACEIIYFRWTLNFVYFVARVIHEVKILKK